MSESRLDLDLVQQFVSAAHSDLDATRVLLEKEPSLVNAAWDWGGGDWETALGGASHMGRRDVAKYLLANGARLDVFAAAMLGMIDIVRAAIEAGPTVVNVGGPHGIPLVNHAEIGGNADVVALIRSKL